jgi:hypothetical protein
MIPASRDFAYARIGKRCAFIGRLTWAETRLLLQET